MRPDLKRIGGGVLADGITSARFIMRIPQASAIRASRGALRLPSSHPVRIFNVTGRSTAFTVASRIRSRVRLVAHQRRAGMPIHHLFDGATEIDVDEPGAAVGVELCRLCHHARLTPRQLPTIGCSSSQLAAICID